MDSILLVLTSGQEVIARDFLATDLEDCQPRKVVDDLMTLASSTIEV